MNDLPPFTADGLLPVGDYELTLEDLSRSILVNRPDRPSWARAWRAKLVANLSVMVQQLVQVGITDIFIDGSFVEDKDLPNDIDGYFVCDVVSWITADTPQRLAELDPIWTWDSSQREPFRRYPKWQLPMWHKYRIELFPDYGQFCGLTDASGNPLTFSQAFRLSRTFAPKGIVKIGGLK
jgi:hypothetical protein